jgi:2-oxoglutarate ferredoxin oxidoreductase subunit alpha
MLDLDIGMNEWLVEPLRWDPARKYDRGKVMNYDMLEAGAEFGRYLDVDGDGIPYRTLPGTHPTRGAFFTRGTSRDRYARYTEEGGPYVDNVDRLTRKFDTARKLAPRAELRKAVKPTRIGVIHFGSTAASMDEAAEMLAVEGVHVDALRIRAFPFGPEVGEFIAAHEQVFVVEQNRDAQMRTLLMTDLGVDPAQLVAILHYDGTPVTARFIRREIATRSRGFAAPLARETAS